MVFLLYLFLLLLLYYCSWMRNILSYNYQLSHADNTRTSSIKDLGVFFDSKLHIHNHVDFIFSECIKLLDLIRSTTFRFSAPDCLYVLDSYFTLVRFKLEYASVVANSITSTDENKLQRIQQKVVSVCFCRFFPFMFCIVILLPWRN
jgi:hypothetical protein